MAKCSSCGGSGYGVEDMPDGSSRRVKCGSCNGSGQQ
jgi:hypothetical protein